MMTRKRTHSKRTWKGRVAAVGVLALLIGMVPAQPSFAVNLTTGPFTVTINEPKDGNQAKFSELADANVILDFYQVAEAKEISGYDAYRFRVQRRFASIESELNEVQAKSENNTLQATDIDNLTQSIAGVVLDSMEEYDSSLPKVAVTDGFKMGQTITVPDGPGLYLILAHGGDLQQYKYTVHNKDGSTALATVADGTAKQYVFMPILVSVPTRGLKKLGDGSFDTEKESWTYPIFAGNTADTGAWTNDSNEDIKIDVKVGEQERYGSLELIKKLDKIEKVSFDNRADTATFVFSIEAKLADKVVYSNVESMVFDAAGTQSKIINHIPAGAVVTVDEVYAGGNYKIVTSSLTNGGVIVADTGDEDVDSENRVKATFENDYGTSFKGGGSVRNHFDSEDGGASWSDEKSTKTYSDGTEEKLAQNTQE